MHFLYKLVIVTSLIFGTFDVRSADLMNLEEILADETSSVSVEELINRIKTSIKPPIIEIEIKSTYQSAMRNDYADAFYNMTLPFSSFSPL